MHFKIWLESQICKVIAVNNSIFNSMDRNYRNYVLKNQIYRKIAKKVQKIVYRRGVRSNDIGLAEYWLLINGKTFSYTFYFLIHLFFTFIFYNIVIGVISRNIRIFMINFAKKIFVGNLIFNQLATKIGPKNL